MTIEATLRDDRKIEFGFYNRVHILTIDEARQVAWTLLDALSEHSDHLQALKVIAQSLSEQDLAEVILFAKFLLARKKQR